MTIDEMLVSETGKRECCNENNAVCEQSKHETVGALDGENQVILLSPDHFINRRERCSECAIIFRQRLN